MVQDIIQTDFIIGRNDLIKGLSEITQYSRQAEYGLSNVKKQMAELNRASMSLETKMPKLDYLNPERMMSKAFGGKAKMPTTKQLFGGLTEDTNFLKQIKNYGQTLGDLKAEGIDVNTQLNDMQSLFGKNSERMKVLNAGFQQAEKRAAMMKNRFDMNTLSWMFGGMALHRYSMMALRFFIPSMEKMEKLNTEASKKVMGVAAAFEFLKISMFETLAQTPLFKNFVEWLIKAALWVSEFAQKHPDIVAIAAALAGIGVVLGGLAMGVGVFMQLGHLLKLLGMSSDGSASTTGGGALGGFNKLNNFLKTGFSFYLVFEGIKDFKEGGVMAAIDELLSLALVWTAGLGWGVAFYLVAQGIKHFTGKDIGEWLTQMVEQWQEKIDETKLYFPADIGKFSEEDNLFKKGWNKVMDFGTWLLPIKDTGWFEGIHKFQTSMSELDRLFVPVNQGFKDMDQNVQAVDDSLVTHSLVPSMDLLNKSILDNITNLPLMTEELINAKGAIDAIPNETHKYIYIHTVRTEGISQNSSYSSSLGGVSYG